MWRVEVGEGLPPVDVDGDLVIGRGEKAQIRIPVGRAEHVRIAGETWRCEGEMGAIGAGKTFEISGMRVHVAPAPSGATPTPPQRTESLARELVRNLLGTDGAPVLVVERGPLVGAKRQLAPPESVLVIGRDAQWSIADDDLSREHAEVRRSWDGVAIRDLGSKNGTRLDGALVREAPLRSGQLVELGKVALRYRDPAEPRDEPAPPRYRRAPWRRAPFWIATAICALAVVGLAWVLLG